MQNGLLILPFVGVFAFVIGLATDSAYKQSPAISWVFFSASLVAFVIWVVKDKQGFVKLFKKKGARHGMSQGLSVVLAILISLGLGFLAKRDRFNKSIDVTRGGMNTLSEASTKIVNQIQRSKARLKIAGFFQSEEKKAEFRRALGLYQGAGAEFEVEYVDPQTDPTRALAEHITIPDTVVVKLGNQEARLTQFSEEKITNALVRVLKQKERKVYFLNGHGEADLSSQDHNGFSLAKAELESERVSVAPINLLELGSVPQDSSALILAGLRYDIKPAERAILENYLERGGPMIVLVDALVDIPEVNRLLEKLGLQLNNDLLVIRPDDPRAKLLGQNNAIVTDFDSTSPLTADFVKRGGVALVTPNTRSLQILARRDSNLKAQSLAKSAEIMVKINNVRNESDLRGGVTTERLSRGRFDVFALSTGVVSGSRLAASDAQSSTSSDVRPNSIGDTGKELRVFVGGSSHLATNLGAQRAENLDLFINAVNYLMQDEDFVSIRAKDPGKSVLDLSSATSQFLLLGITWIYPFLFLGFGVFYWLRRRYA